MGKKKKGKSQKYAKVGSDDSFHEKSKPSKGEQRGNKPRRSKRTRRSIETNNNVNDFKFRREVEDGTRTIIDIAADGNCLFGSLSDQLYHDLGNMHSEVRHEVCDFIDALKEEFENFLVLEEDDEDVADFDAYVLNMREDGEWGGNVELVAASRLYGRNIVVFSTEHAFTIEHGQSESGGPDMMLSYHGSEHYNSVRDDQAGMPPPPSRTLVAKPEKLTIIESTESETEMILPDNNEDKMDIVVEETVEMDEEPPPTKPKRNDPCPCGSGLRYKKCCLESDKSKERARKWKAKHGSSTSDDNAMEGSNDEDEEKMDGNFRVLKI